jgi:two-component system, OmpR family, phosphate regulon sensor histidine kinase PhoR
VDRTGAAAADSGPAQGTPPPVGVRSHWWLRLSLTPPRAVAACAAVGLCWSVAAGRLLSRVADPSLREAGWAAQGVLLVLLSAAVLLWLVRRAQGARVRFGTEVRAAVESMIDGVLVIDRGGVVEANRAAVELLGAGGKDELLGGLERFWARLQPRAADGVPLPASELPTARAARGERVTQELAVRRGDGREAVLSVAAAPVVGEGAGGLAIAVFRDVSAAHRLEAMRDEFLATAAHELKTPLAVVKAYAQLVGRRTPAEAPALAVVERQVDRMTRLVQHLLDASRLRLDPGAGPTERFDLAGLAAEVVEGARRASSRHDLQLRAPAPALVQGDRERVARVLRSLLDNAVRFSPRGGPVETRVEAGDGEVVVSVADQGMGIPADRQARVFERYYRAHAGTAEDYGGLGLSLDTSREIVARHGGRIWFESTPGRGSTFHFSLPTAPEGGP